MFGHIEGKVHKELRDLVSSLHEVKKDIEMEAQLKKMDYGDAKSLIVKIANIEKRLGRVVMLSEQIHSLIEEQL